MPSARLITRSPNHFTAFTFAGVCSSGVNQQVMSWMVVLSSAPRGGLRNRCEAWKTSARVRHGRRERFRNWSAARPATVDGRLATERS